MFNFNTFILTHVVGYLNQQTPYASEERSWTQFLRIAASILHRIIYRLRMILHKINGKKFCACYWWSLFSPRQCHFFNVIGLINLNIFKRLSPAFLFVCTVFLGGKPFTMPLFTLEYKWRLTNHLAGGYLLVITLNMSIYA